MKMIEYSRYYVGTLLILSCTVPKRWFMLYHTNHSHEVPLSFVWLKFSSFGWDDDGWRNKECQKPKIGDAMRHPKIMFKKTQVSNLGDRCPR
jgi:hypothetical protein